MKKKWGIIDYLVIATIIIILLATSWTEKGKWIYTVTSTDGRLMMRKEEELQFTGNYVRSINIAGIAAGNYILTISNGKQKLSRQFIKK